MITTACSSNTWRDDFSGGQLAWYSPGFIHPALRQTVPVVTGLCFLQEIPSACIDLWHLKANLPQTKHKQILAIY